MARWQITLLIAGLVLTAGALVGVSLWDGPDTTHEAGPREVRPINQGDEYVALGDSYTSAPGTGRSTDDACLQTAANYPHTVAEELGLRLTDVSCGGAKTNHVTESRIFRSTHHPPQADAISPGTDLVTVGIGGNDVNVFGVVAYVCTTLRARDPSGAPCQTDFAARRGSNIERRADRMEESLVGVIKHVAKGAPSARIVVVGYPELFPKAGPCEQLPLALGDYAFAYRINELVVRAQKRAAARTNVEYVDVFTASRGHNMCAKDPWIAGLRPTRSDAMPLHPYPEEQQLVADLLLDLLNGTAPPKRERPPDR